MDDLEVAIEKFSESLQELVTIMKKMLVLMEEVLNLAIDFLVEDFRHEIDLMFPDY